MNPLQVRRRIATDGPANLVRLAKENGLTRGRVKTKRPRLLTQAQLGPFLFLEENLVSLFRMYQRRL